MALFAGPNSFEMILEPIQRPGHFPTTSTCEMLERLKEKNWKIVRQEPPVEALWQVDPGFRFLTGVPRHLRLACKMGSCPLLVGTT